MSYPLWEIDEGGNVDIALQMASMGYLVVLQDIRGRYASEGEFTWLFQDKSESFDDKDGYDTVEWAATLPGSDGQVAVWGHSFPAWCAWRLAEVTPPSLKALFPSGMSARSLDVNFGVLELGRRFQSTYDLASDARRRDAQEDSPISRDMKWPPESSKYWHEVERGKWIWYLPLSQIPDHVFSTLTPMLKRFMSEQHKEMWEFDKTHNKVNVPVCVMTGWYDRFVGAVENFAGMVVNGPVELRNQHRLIVGPWGHNNLFKGTTRRDGPLDFGALADTFYANEAIRWFDYQLKGIDNGIGSEPPVRLFMMGENRWRFLDSWPPENVRSTDFFLHSNGSANTIRGDGRLSICEPANDPPDKYQYDPRDPVMSLMDISSHSAPREQSPLDGRSDILVYVSVR